MTNLIKVGMADLNAIKSPGTLVTLGLGSCIGIGLYDKRNKIAGLAHIMLPNSNDIKNNSNKAKFADTAIELLLHKMLNLGASRNYITAKIAGGSQMFNFNSNSGILRIGERNTNATVDLLNKLKIPIITSDTGGSFGRTIELNAENGDLLVKTIGHGTKII